MLNDWSTQTMRYAQSMQQSLQQALRQNQQNPQNPQNPQGRPSQPYNPPRIQTERATREFQSTSDKKQRRHKNGFVTVLEIVIIIAVIASIGGMLSDSLSNIISEASSRSCPHRKPSAKTLESSTPPEEKHWK